MRVHIVDRLPGILLKVDALHAHHAGNAGTHINKDFAFADNRVIKLADLIALRQVGVKVVFAVKS